MGVKGLPAILLLTLGACVLAQDEIVKVTETPAVISSGDHAFTVLDTANTVWEGREFLVLKVQIPKDETSKNENWCKDYQKLCEGYNLRPTGCSKSWLHYTVDHIQDSIIKCGKYYNSDMTVVGKGANEHGLCPIGGWAQNVALIANQAFGKEVTFTHSNSKERTKFNTFAFAFCDSCGNQWSQATGSALQYTHYPPHTDKVAYTVCVKEAPNPFG